MNYKDLFYVTLISILFSFNLINKRPVQGVIDSAFSLVDQPLQISSRLLTSDESETILKHDLLAKGYQPIEVTISNSGSHTYTISRASTSLSCATAEKIAWKETKRSIPRGVGFKVISFVFWPFGVVSTIDSIYGLKKHRSIIKVLKAKGFKDESEEILPYSLIKRVLYIPNDQFAKRFTLALEDVTTGELVVLPVQLSED